MKFKGAFVATAALGLLAGGATVASAGHHEAGESKVKCTGVNSCAGKGQCNAADGSHDCAGKYSCHGKGWVYADSDAACTEQGGTVVK